MLRQRYSSFRPISGIAGRLREVCFLLRRVVAKLHLKILLPLALLPAMFLCLEARAQNPPVAPPSQNQPDVQVLIMHDPVGQDMVDLTYPGVVSASQAQRDLDAISKASGLAVADREITNGALPFNGVTSTTMTSATFTTSGAIPQGQTYFRIEPWIVALRGYKTLAITYIVPPDFVFDGLESYRNSYVDIGLDRRGGTITYHVRVLNSSFDRLDLPLTQTQAVSINHAAQERRQSTLRVVEVLVISVVAVAVGYSVYTLVSRAT